MQRKLEIALFAVLLTVLFIGMIVFAALFFPGP